MYKSPKMQNAHNGHFCNKFIDLHMYKFQKVQKRKTFLAKLKNWHFSKWPKISLRGLKSLWEVQKSLKIAHFYCSYISNIERFSSNLSSDPVINGKSIVVKYYNMWILPVSLAPERIFLLKILWDSLICMKADNNFIE